VSPINHGNQILNTNASSSRPTDCHSAYLHWQLVRPRYLFWNHATSLALLTTPVSELLQGANELTDSHCLWLAIRRHRCCCEKQDNDCQRQFTARLVRWNKIVRASYLKMRISHPLTCLSFVREKQEIQLNALPTIPDGSLSLPRTPFLGTFSWLRINKSCHPHQPKSK